MDEKFIAECENEPLNRSGAIQSFGTLVVVDRELVVTHLARNASDFFPESALPVIGEPLPQALRHHVEASTNALGLLFRQSWALTGRNGPLDLCVIRSGDSLLLEYTMGVDTPEAFPLPRHVVPGDEEGLQVMRQELVDKVFAMSGFQRVMYYGFARTAMVR